MSGCGYSSTCPRCGGEMDSYSDSKPYDTVDHTCLNCGFYAFTGEDRYTLEEVNELRADQDMPKIEKLKEQE